MIEVSNLPNTLQEAIIYFSDASFCLELVAQMRWENGIATCPQCESQNASFLKTRKIWKCRDCKKQFSVKVGTIFEDSALGLDKWLVAIWLITNSKNGISSHELGRSLGFCQKTAWFVLQRIRMAMETGSFVKLSGDVEVDETFVGGKAKNMHKAKRAKLIQGRGSVNKTAVIGLLERKGNVRARVIQKVDRNTLHSQVKQNVETGTNLYTDEWRGYNGLEADYIHEVINHSVEYVRGNVSTNGIENFWSLLKRSIKGTYVSVSPQHLQRYVTEQTFRFNERKGNDKSRFIKAVSSISGKRLTYNELISK